MVKFIKDHKPAVKTAVVGSVVFLAIGYGLDNLPGAGTANLRRKIDRLFAKL